MSSKIENNPKQIVIHYTDHLDLSRKIGAALSEEFEVIHWNKENLSSESLKNVLPAIFLIDLLSINPELIVKLVTYQNENELKHFCLFTYLFSPAIKSDEHLFLSTFTMQPLPISFQHLGIKTKEIFKLCLEQSEQKDFIVLEAKQQTIQQLTVTLSHHINNSLTVILGNMEVLDPNNANDVVQFIHHTKFHINKILAVLDTLQHMAYKDRLNLMQLVGKKDYLFDIQEELAKRLEMMGENLSENLTTWK
ncbi:MAG: hypothetical protein N2450_00755 [bacterium]|nr:hypothetical protein [bacterium]